MKLYVAVIPEEVDYGKTMVLGCDAGFDRGCVAEWLFVRVPSARFGDITDIRSAFG
ncbi:MAG: hypothetical protein HY234_01870 [Acidobacteria bacterium]|nr:hypothetical protein [Acidobacteriota bacterium]